MRNVPFSGIEWSYQMRDLGFNEKGMLTEAAMGIEMTDIKGKENLKNRGDTSLDFLEKEIEI